MLTHTNYIKVFNGKNVNSQEIIVNSEFFIKSKKSLDKSSGKSKTLGKRKLFIDVQEDDSFDIINFFKEVIEKKEKQVGLYKFCKVSDVLNELSSSLTKEECIENAKKYKTQKEWKIYDLRYYNRSYIKGWISECSAHFVNLRGISRTKEECIKDAKKYESSKNWRENSPVYGYAYKSKWMDECSAHFIKLNGISRTKEECIEDAKKYKTIKEWRENSGAIYGYAISKKWLQECSAHLINLNTSRTLEQCVENAKKYETKKEWYENSSIIYKYVVRKKWMAECSAHFINSINKKTRTKEECIDDAKKYKTQKEWIENSPTIYKYAYKNKWMDECSAQMTKLNGVSKTKEECIEDARNYKTKKEWRANSSAFYGYASNKKWMNECSAHFINLRDKKIRTLKECIDDARKYESSKSWKKNSPTIYGYAVHRKWLKEIKSLIFNQ